MLAQVYRDFLIFGVLTGSRRLTLFTCVKNNIWVISEDKTLITVFACAMITAHSLLGPWIGGHRPKGAQGREAILATRGQHGNWASKGRRLELRWPNSGPQVWWCSPSDFNGTSPPSAAVQNSPKGCHRDKRTQIVYSDDVYKENLVDGF